MSHRFRVSVIVTLKAGVLDPQGKAIENALSGMGFKGVEGVRQGKHFSFFLRAPSEEEAQHEVVSLCENLLVNGVVEDYRVEITR